MYALFSTFTFGYGDLKITEIRQHATELRSSKDCRVSTDHSQTVFFFQFLPSIVCGKVTWKIHTDCMQHSLTTKTIRKLSKSVSISQS